MRLKTDRSRIGLDGAGRQAERLVIGGDSLLELPLARERLPQRQVYGGVFPAEPERLAQGVDRQARAVDRQEDEAEVVVRAGGQVVLVLRIELDGLHQLRHGQVVLLGLPVRHTEFQPGARVGRRLAYRLQPVFHKRGGAPTRGGTLPGGGGPGGAPQKKITPTPAGLCSSRTLYALIRGGAG